MPLIIEGGRVPPRWAERQRRALGLVESHAEGAEGVRIAFVNNMPDAALEDTEMQFFELLEAAGGDTPVRVKLHSLTGVPRGERGQQHLRDFYFGMDDLFNHQFEGLIMTGAEPRHPNLRNEPYWSALVNILDWAEGNTVSTVLSCLSAHAGVLYSDGIDRHLLSDKQFGVFTFTKTADHPLMRGTGEQICFPHSRWHEVKADALSAAGYSVLTQSAKGGVDSFVKKKKRCLFVHFQGHPEYDGHTLLKEYRRDISRFIRGERETYPSAPKGYLDATFTKLVTEFRHVALSSPREGLMEHFPEAILARTLQKTWHSSAMAIYRNWLRYLVTNKPDTPQCLAVRALLKDDYPGERSALREEERECFQR